jgi:FkbM family methyltransferase
MRPKAGTTADRPHAQRAGDAIFHLSLRLSDSGNVFERSLLRNLMRFRRRAGRLYDPIVSYEFEGARLLLPLSHNLPFLRKAWPSYARNLTTVARAVAAKYDSLTAVDVGANIGDSIALMRRAGTFPILAIEGYAPYYRLLLHNTSGMTGVETVMALLHSSTGELHLDMSAGHGTAGLVKSTRSQSMTSTSLMDLLETHPEFLSAKLLKVDTDGSDCAILLGSRPWLERARPVTVFEYDPLLFGEQDRKQGLRTLQMLEEIGYSTAIFYDHTGDFLLATGLSDACLLAELDHYLEGQSARRYADVCVFPSEDEDIARAIRSAEMTSVRAGDH